MNEDEAAKLDIAKTALETAYANAGLGFILEFASAKAHRQGTTLEAVWAQQQEVGWEQAQGGPGPRE